MIAAFDTDTNEIKMTEHATTAILSAFAVSLKLQLPHFYFFSEYLLFIPFMFKKISLHGWRQFRSVEITFHPRLTILTGANGAGKTTLLNLVSRHFGWQSILIGTPKIRGQNPQMAYSTDYWNTDDHETSEEDSDLSRDLSPPQPSGARVEIGAILYSNGVTSTLSIPAENPASQYEINQDNFQNVEGLHIPSHRATYSYQQVQSIPTVPRRRNDAFQHYLNLVRTRFAGGHTQWSPQYYMKETLIALATFGYGNTAVEADHESAAIFEEFQSVLKMILPEKLGFQRLVVRVPEIILETRSGRFSIDAVSGGVGAVIDLAWQVFMYQASGSEFVVTLDEPENHLHPQLQRRILADLVKAFPNVQFVVATHSPFIVGSVANSNVFVLDYDESGKVNSELLDTVNKAGSANEILRDVLGLEFTMPVWVQTELEEIISKYSERDFTNESLAEMRLEMAALGLEKMVPQTIARLASQIGTQP